MGNFFPPSPDYYPFRHLYDRVMVWSASTFGTAKERGPLGPLRHLEKEAAEAQADCGDLTEYADCLIVLLDATWRAGFSSDQLVNEAIAKMLINEKREWPKVTDPNAPVEHDRSKD